MVVAVTPGMLAAIFILGIIYYRVQVGCCQRVRQAALQLKCGAACWPFTWHAYSMLHADALAGPNARACYWACSSPRT